MRGGDAGDFFIDAGQPVQRSPGICQPLGKARHIIAIGQPRQMPAVANRLQPCYPFDLLALS